MQLRIINYKKYCHLPPVKLWWKEKLTSKKEEERPTVINGTNQEQDIRASLSQGRDKPASIPRQILE